MNPTLIPGRLTMEISIENQERSPRYNFLSRSNHPSPVQTLLLKARKKGGGIWARKIQKSNVTECSAKRWE
jgi:hypothetical protein